MPASRLPGIQDPAAVATHGRHLTSGMLNVLGRDGDTAPLADAVRDVGNSVSQTAADTSVLVQCPRIHASGNPLSLGMHAGDLCRELLDLAHQPRLAGLPACSKLLHLPREVRDLGLQAFYRFHVPEAALLQLAFSLAVVL